MVTASTYSAHKHRGGWASFQNWIKKWNRIMSMIFSALVVTLLVAVVIVNTLDAHEEAQKEEDDVLEIQQTKKISFNDPVCNWDRDDYCYLDCMSGDSSAINNELEIYWNERPTCHGILKVNIRAGIRFSNYILPAKWLTAKVSINELIFEFRNFDTVEVDAFATEAFSTVQKLTLLFASPRIMEMGTLNGLHSLKSLDFASSGIRFFTAGVLDNLAGTLEELTLTEWIRSSSALLVDGLTGSAPMTALKRVKFYYNMDHTVTERTFVGLTSVTHLYLNGCQIVTIGVNSFNPISNTIQELNLSGNKLTTLATGLFDLIIPRPGVRISIDSNLWECNCQLCYFKWVLLNSEVIDQSSSMECRTPSSLRYAPVRSTDFCPDTDCELYELIPTVFPPNTNTFPSTNTDTDQTTREINTIPSDDENTTENTTENSTENTTENPTTTVEEEVVPQICTTLTSGEPISEIINLNASVSTLQIFGNNTGEVFVGVESYKINSALLWFDSDGYNCAHERKSIPDDNKCGPTQCHISSYNANGGSQRIHIKNLKTNKAYIFCVVGDVEKASLSPLNCIPHFVAPEPTKPPDETVWLKTDHRELLIGMIVLGITVSVLLGMALGYVVLQRNPGWLRGSKHVTMVSSSTAISNQKSDRIGSVSTQQTDVFNVEQMPGVDQSYVTASILSAFERLQYKLDKTEENQYYMDGMPYIVAPCVPNLQSITETAVESVSPLPYTISKSRDDYDHVDEPEDHYSTIVINK